MHIISVQMLLILLKRIIQFGNYKTMEDIDYEILEDDYKKIIQLQLAVVEKVNEKHLAELDANHFLYSTYYLNYQRNVAHEFLRMYYMMEVVGRDKNNFDLDIRGEYSDYYTVFAQKYGFTPTQYSSFLFGELITYYSDVNSLICNSMWRNIEGFYGQIKEKELISKVINILSCSIEAYKKWAIESEN